MIRRKRLLTAVLVFSLVTSITAWGQSKPVLTVYTYNSFTSEWGPGPTLTKDFEAQCGCDLNWVSLEDGAALLARLKLEGKSTKADVVLGLDTNLTAEAKATGLIAPHGLDLSSLSLPISWNDADFVPYDWGYFAFVYDSQKLSDPPASLAELTDGKDSPKIVIPQDFELPRRQRGQIAMDGGWRRDRVPGREPLDQPSRDRRGEQGVAGVDQPHGGREVLRGDVLEQEAARPERQRGIHISVEVEGGQHDHSAAGHLGQDAAGGLQAVQDRHADVHQDHVGPQRARGRHRLGPVGGLAHHLDAAGGQYQPETGPDQRLVVGDQNAGHGRSSGMRARTRYPPPSRRRASRSPP